MKNNPKNIKHPESETTDEYQKDLTFDSEKAPHFPFLGRRFAEFLIASFISSLPFSLMYQFGFPNSNYWGFRIFTASLLIFVAINIYLLRAFYYSMGNRQIYFNVNFSAYALYAVLNLAVLFFLGDNKLPSVYSYFFMPMKLAVLGMTSIFPVIGKKLQAIAVIITHLFMVGIICASPLEMYNFDNKKRRK